MLICLRSARRPATRLREPKTSHPGPHQVHRFMFFFRQIAMRFTFFFQNPLFTCAIVLGVGIRGSTPAFASRVARPRSEIRLATFDSIRLVLRELRPPSWLPAQAIFHPPLAPATAVMVASTCARATNVSSWYSGCALFRAANLQWCCSTIVEVRLQSWRSLTVSPNWRRMKPTCIKSQHCDAMGSEGRSELSQAHSGFARYHHAPRDHGALIRCTQHHAPFRSGTTHAPRR